MDQATWLAKAREGDADAIATLITRGLHTKGITARAVRHSYRLTLWLEAEDLPDQRAAVEYIRRGMQRLQVASLGTVLIYGQQTDAEAPDWSEEISLLGTLPSAEADRQVAPGPKLPQPSAVPQGPEALMAAPLPRRRSQPPVKAQPAAVKPLVIKASDFEPMKTAIILFVAVYGFLGARNPGLDGPFIWLHYPDLAIHETGHLLFLPFGRFLMILGGSLTQIVFPAAFTIYFFWSQQFFSSALTLFWTGQNFMDVGVYMADAPYRVLPLTVDDPNAHDWYNLFTMMGCLDQAGLIAGLTHWIGVLLYGASVVLGLYFIRRETLHLRQRLEQIGQAR
ncbi:MAG: hypothetical protein ICV62_11165 [Cyanobacteria bacterium Co-bin13]|nr:hypothetical protein [Cyanobacteria bacterium Co-bin13]